MKHPAESTTAAGAVALLAGLIAGLDPKVVAAVGVVLGFVPALVTTLVNAGGIRGAVRRIWRGRDNTPARPPDLPQ